VLCGADRNLAVASSAVTWLRNQGTRLHIVITSTQPLQIPGEHEWPVLPLEVPPPSATADEVFDYPAVALFLDRLRQVRSRPVGKDEAATVATLVRRLGGVPLALELAAGRGRVLELDEMLARSDEDEADPPGQSLRDAVLGSWRLLGPGEQECLCWLAVFQWRWSMDLAEHLLSGGPIGRAGGDVVALIDRLVGRGLVSVRSDLPDLRFWLLEAVRSVALGQAEGDGILPMARDRHARLMAAVAARVRSDLLGEAGSQHAAKVRLDHLSADLQSAMDHLRATDPEAASAMEAHLTPWHRLRGD
jgi:predicted ATPase